MQARKARVILRRLRDKEKTLIQTFLKNINAPGIVDMERLVALDIEGGTYSDIFELTPLTLRMLDALQLTPYSIGFYVGLIDKVDLKFKPSLPLAMRACRLCRGGAAKCYLLREREALRFTYGRRVRLTGNYKVEDVGAEHMHVRPVISSDGACLGWGMLQSRGSIKYLHPLLDLGWYLRRGG